MDAAEDARDKARSIVKHKFTPSEDVLLHELVKRNGISNWKLIARSMPNRTSRQCRERWKYYLSNSAGRQDVWTKEEDALLVEKYDEIGPRWATLALFFDGKNDINLKNRFHRLQRSQYRQEPTAFSSSEDVVDEREKGRSSRELIEFPGPISLLMEPVSA